MEVLKQIPDCSIDCCITSPPYYQLRNYETEGQIGQEETPEKYIEKLTSIFKEVRRVLKKEGTLWLNIGDSYSKSGNNNKNDLGVKPKELIGIPWLLAFALRKEGWYLRQDIIWNKTNPMPESVKDRCTKSHEYIFLLSKSPKYYYNQQAIQEPSIYQPGSRKNQKQGEFEGKYKDAESRISRSFRAIRKFRNKRDVWTVSKSTCKEAHFAVFPERLIEPCVLAGCPEGGTVIDPFMGSGTTAVVALRYSRNYIGIEINPEYCNISKKRIENVQIDLCI